MASKTPLPQLSTDSVDCSLPFVSVMKEVTSIKNLVSELHLEPIDDTTQKTSKRLQEKIIKAVFQNRGHVKRYHSLSCKPTKDLEGNLLSIFEVVDFLTACAPSETEFYSTKIACDLDKAIAICLETSSQSLCSLWHLERSVRISSSRRAHQIKTCRGSLQKLAESLISSKFLGNEATKWGRDMEKVAKEAFESKYNVTVIDCGLCVSPECPWLCSSPDGIVLSDGIAVGLLEIKCPFSVRNQYLFDDHGTPKLHYLKKDKHGNVSLNKSHAYYTQCQINMYILNYAKMHFYVYTTVDTLLVSVEYDDEFIGTIIPVLEKFYFCNLLPMLSRSFEKNFPKKE